MYIKSRELLPVDQQAVGDEEDEAEDPRWELIRQLVEYKKFKDAAAQLQLLESAQDRIFPRLPPRSPSPAAPIRPEVSLFDLINAVNGILKRVTQREDLRDIFEDKWTVSEKIEQLVGMLQNKAALRFSELFASATSRSEVVVTFLALLELIRLKQLTITQEEQFGEIEISRAQVPPLAATFGAAAKPLASF